jgi:hypothetical protein
LNPADRAGFFLWLPVKTVFDMEFYAGWATFDFVSDQHYEEITVFLAARGYLYCFVCFGVVVFLTAKGAKFFAKDARRC